MSLVTAIKTYKTPYALKAEELRELVGAPLSQIEFHTALLLTRSLSLHRALALSLNTLLSATPAGISGPHTTAPS